MLTNFIPLLDIIPVPPSIGQGAFIRELNSNNGTTVKKAMNFFCSLIFLNMFISILLLRSVLKLYYNFIII